MKKQLYIQWAAMIMLVVAVSGCLEEPLLYDGADCGGCEDPGPPIIKDGTSPCGDLIISNLSYAVINDTYLQIDVQLKNVGAGIVSDADYIRQAYISLDTNIDAGDLGAGAVVQSIHLLPGQTVTHVIQSFNPDALAKGKYIIVYAMLDERSNDCNLNNNIAVIPIAN